MPSAYEVFFGPVNRAVTIKLLQYSLLMFAAPIGTYFAALHLVFKGDPHMVGWCGIAAVVVANLVIAAYVVMAWNEVDPEDAGAEEGVKRAAKAYRVD